MLSILILLSLMAILFTGCSAVFHTAGTGEIVGKTYDFKDFTNVEVSDAVKYEVIQSNDYSVVVSTHEDILDHLDIYQSGNTVHIGLKFDLHFGLNNVMVTITMPQLSKLVVSGASEGKATGFDSTGNLEITVSGASDLNMGIKAGQSGLDVSGSSKITGNLTSTDTKIVLAGDSDLVMTLQTGKTDMDISGSSEITGDLQAQDSQITLSGASNCTLTGSAGNTLIEASGSSRMSSPDLTLKSADVKLIGASYASIHTDGTLNIDLSGSSKLDYTGNPTVGKIEVSEASKINHKE